MENSQADRFLHDDILHRQPSIWLLQNVIIYAFYGFEPQPPSKTYTSEPRRFHRCYLFSTYVVIKEWDFLSVWVSIVQIPYKIRTYYPQTNNNLLFCIIYIILINPLSISNTNNNIIFSTSKSILLISEQIFFIYIFISIHYSRCIEKLDNWIILLFHD